MPPESLARPVIFPHLLSGSSPTLQLNFPGAVTARRESSSLFRQLLLWARQCSIYCLSITSFILKTKTTLLFVYALSERLKRFLTWKYLILQHSVRWTADYNSSHAAQQTVLSLDPKLSGDFLWWHDVFWSRQAYLRPFGKLPPFLIWDNLEQKRSEDLSEDLRKIFGRSSEWRLGAFCN